MYDCVKETKHMKSCYQFNLPLIFQFLITTKEIEKLGNFKVTFIKTHPGPNLSLPEFSLILISLKVTFLK